MLAALRDITEEDPTEVEAGKYNLNFVNWMVTWVAWLNGAGLAMATMDMIKLSGGEPANFLDIGRYSQCANGGSRFPHHFKRPESKSDPH